MENTNDKPQRPAKTDYTGLFMIVGAGIGTALGTSDHNMIWLPIFMFLGAAFGAFVTRRNKGNS